MAKSPYFENAYALIIGISKYQDDRIPELKYTSADADEFSKLLIDPKKVGIRKENVTVLLDENATKSKIKKAIVELIKRTDENSVVFIFFAGHGGVEEDHHRREKDNLAKYLLPWDSDFDTLYSTALSNREFSEDLDTIRYKKLAVFIDACHSGAICGGAARDLKTIEDPYKRLAEGEGKVIIAASKPEQRSYEDAKFGHGIFTYHLLEALSGKADVNKDGYVTVFEVFEYLRDKIPASAREVANSLQEPDLKCENFAKEFIISVSPEIVEQREKESNSERKITKLRELYSMGKFSGKQYERLRQIVKTDIEKLSEMDRNISKFTDDLLSREISIETFLEDLEDIEPELSKISKKEKERENKGRKEIEGQEAEEKQEKQRLSEEHHRRAVEEKRKKEAEQLEQERLEREALLSELSALYSKGMEAIAVQDWSIAIKQFKELLALDAGYKDASVRLKEAKQQLDLAKEKERQQLEEQEKEKARQEQLKSLYNKGKHAANAKDWQVAIAAFQEVAALDSRYKDTAKLLVAAESEQKKAEKSNIPKSLVAKILGRPPSGEKEEIKVREVEDYTNSIGMEFALIPAGEFDMGSPSSEKDRRNNEGPVHHVNITNAFYIGKYTVTQKQWHEIMGKTHYSIFRPLEGRPYRDIDLLISESSDLPIEGVLWDEVRQFIEKLNEKESTNKYRLPSEAEWEYAARAGTITRYSFGDDDSDLDDYGWYEANSNRETHKVGQKRPNPWGIYDMHGNVWEWVQDEWHDSYNGAPTDGSAWESAYAKFRVNRGGSKSNFAGDCRVSKRTYGRADGGGGQSSIGIRLVMDICK